MLGPGGGNGDGTPSGKGPPAWKQLQVVAGMIAAFPSQSRLGLGEYVAAAPLPLPLRGDS
jgi:hypothetical protein